MLLTKNRKSNKKCQKNRIYANPISVQSTKEEKEAILSSKLKKKKKFKFPTLIDYNLWSPVSNNKAMKGAPNQSVIPHFLKQIWVQTVRIKLRFSGLWLLFTLKTAFQWQNWWRCIKGHGNIAGFRIMGLGLV